MARIARHTLFGVAIVTVTALALLLPRASERSVDAVGPDTWTAAPDMGVARINAQPVTLQDGTVLITGPATQAQRFDATTDTWLATASMNMARNLASLAVLADGRVLATGGFAGGPVASAEVYDPTANTWTAVAPMPAGRWLHSATTLADGRVLVVGGHQGLTAVIYDPVANAWSTAATPSQTWITHDAVRLASGRVLLANAGSVIGNDEYSAEIYDPVMNSWSDAGQLSNGRESGSLTVLADGRVLAVGGFTRDLEGQFEIAWETADIYDPVGGAWSPVAPMPSKRHGHTATLLANGLVLVAGGREQESGAAQSDVYLYNPSLDAWSTVSSMLDPRHGAGAARRVDDVLVLGGHDGSSALLSAEYYEPGDIPPPDVTETPTATPTTTTIVTDTVTPTPTGFVSSDYDGDGILNPYDNCYTVPNNGQENNDINFIELDPWGKPYDDRTLAYSDAADDGWGSAGDACDPDDDNDGLSDVAELDGSSCVGVITDEFVEDSDSDRYLDGAECALGTDPLSATSKPLVTQCGAAADSDSDGVLDRVEYCLYNTNPGNPNTDGDWCWDGKEIASINADYTVNAMDLGQVAQAFGGATMPQYVPNFDTNKDGTINAMDLMFIAQRFGPC